MEIIIEIKIIPSVRIYVNPDTYKHTNSHTDSHSHILNPQKPTMFLEKSGSALLLLHFSKHKTCRFHV